MNWSSDLQHSVDSRSRQKKLVGMLIPTMNLPLSRFAGFDKIQLEWRLYEEPFTNFGANAVEKLFSQIEVGELLELVGQFVLC